MPMDETVGALQRYRWGWEERVLPFPPAASMKYVPRQPKRAVVKRDWAAVTNHDIIRNRCDKGWAKVCCLFRWDLSSALFNDIYDVTQVSSDDWHTARSRWETDKVSTMSSFIMERAVHTLPLDIGFEVSELRHTANVELVARFVFSIDRCLGYLESHRLSFERVLHRWIDISMRYSTVARAPDGSVIEVHESFVPGPDVHIPTRAELKAISDAKWGAEFIHERKATNEYDRMRRTALAADSSRRRALAAAQYAALNAQNRESRLARVRDQADARAARTLGHRTVSRGTSASGASTRPRGASTLASTTRRR